MPACWGVAVVVGVVQSVALCSSRPAGRRMFMVVHVRQHLRDHPDRPGPAHGATPSPSTVAAQTSGPSSPPRGRPPTPRRGYADGPLRRVLGSGPFTPASGRKVAGRPPATV